MRTVRAMLVDDRGATLVEYSLIVTLIAVVVIAVALSFGTALSGMYQKIATTLRGA